MIQIETKIEKQMWNKRIRYIKYNNLLYNIIGNSSIIIRCKRNYTTGSDSAKEIKDALIRLQTFLIDTRVNAVDTRAIAKSIRTIIIDPQVGTNLEINNKVHQNDGIIESDLEIGKSETDTTKASLSGANKQIVITNTLIGVLDIGLNMIKYGIIIVDTRITNAVDNRAISLDICIETLQIVEGMEDIGICATGVRQCIMDIGRTIMNIGPHNPEDPEDSAGGSDGANGTNQPIIGKYIIIYGIIILSEI